MIRHFASATLMALFPLASASGATFTYDATATLTLTSLVGAPGDITITPLVLGPADAGGFELTEGGTTERDVSTTELASGTSLISGIRTEISGSGASGAPVSFAVSSASLAPGFFIRTNGLSAVTANFTFAFEHRISTTAALGSSTSTATSFIGLTEFRNGVRTDLVRSPLLLNTGFALGDPASDSAEDRGTVSFSVFVPEGFVWSQGGLQFFVEARGEARTFFEATPAPIPVPPSAAMFVAGLGLLTLLRRRRTARI